MKECHWRESLPELKDFVILGNLFLPILAFDPRYRLCWLEGIQHGDLYLAQGDLSSCLFKDICLCGQPRFKLRLVEKNKKSLLIVNFLINNSFASF